MFPLCAELLVTFTVLFVRCARMLRVLYPNLLWKGIYILIYIATIK